MHIDKIAREMDASFDRTATRSAVIKLRSYEESTERTKKNR